MAVSRIAMENFRQHAGRIPVIVKGQPTEKLLDIIEGTTGVAYRPKLVPYPYQLETLAFLVRARRALALLRMRLGKALQNGTPVATPRGWRPIETLSIGDLVFGRDGKPYQVSGVFPQVPRPMYTLRFADGSDIVADADHLWAVTTPRSRHERQPPLIKTTQELADEKLDLPQGGWRYAVPVCDPVAHEEKQVPIDPYMLGVLLGDGALTQCSLDTDAEIVESLSLPKGVSFYTRDLGTAIGGGNLEFAHVSAHFRGLRPYLRHLGLEGCLSKNKHIPLEYMRGSIQQRFALLQGLLDTDGMPTPNAARTSCNVHWGSASPMLAAQVQELIQSLGGIAKLQVKQAPSYWYNGEKRFGLPHYHMSARLPASLGCPFRLRRKACRWLPLNKFPPLRNIIGVEKCNEDGEATCISVESPDNLFLIKNYITTHNTKIALDFAELTLEAGWWQGKGLVITPSPVLLSVWEREIAKHTNLRPAIVHSTNINDLYRALGSPAELIVMPWSSLQAMFSIPTTRGKKSLTINRPLLRDIAMHFEFACIDETHTAKNPDTLRFRIAEELTANCPLYVGLTGTPHGRSPFDLWAQVYLVDGGDALGRNFQFFQQAFGVMKRNWFNKRGFEYVFDKRLMPQLDRKLAAVSISYGWEGNIDLPAITRNVVELQMTAEQKKEYKRLMVEGVTAHRQHNEEKVKASFTRLRQVSSGFLPFETEDGKMEILDLGHSAKMEWLEQLIEVQLPTGVPIILVHDFIHTGERICELLTQLKRKHVWLWGGISGKKQTEAEQRFMSGAVDIMVMNRAGSMGLDLSRADYVCFVECPLSVTQRQQIEARPMSTTRAARPIIIDDLVCSHVDRRILSLIREGKDMLAHMIFAEAI